MLKQLRNYLVEVDHYRGLPYVYKCVKHVKGIMAEDENNLEYVLKILYILTCRKEFGRLIRLQEIFRIITGRKRKFKICDKSWLDGICIIEDMSNYRPIYGV